MTETPQTQIAKPIVALASSGFVSHNSNAPVVSSAWTAPQYPQRTSAFSRLVPANNQVTSRLDLQCAAIGFAAPPCSVHLRFQPNGDNLSLLVRSPVDKQSVVAAWLQGHGPTSISCGTGLAPKLLRAEFSQVPAAWSRLLAAVQVKHLTITLDGDASLFVECNPAALAAFVAEIGQSGPVRTRAVVTGPADSLTLTPRQHEALSTAVALGYYEIPHRVDLRALASSMGISLGSVSELLRRGEAAIITGHVDRMAASIWETSSETTTLRPQAATPAVRVAPTLGFRRMV